MPVFEAQVKLLSGETRRVMRESESQASLLAALRVEGYVPVRVRETATRMQRCIPPASAKRPRRKDVQEFMNSFAVLLRSGMDLARCLRTLEREARGPLRAVLAVLSERVRGGESLSAGMAGTGVFTLFQINIIRAGEYGGNLPQALGRIATLMERESELRAKIRNAVAYPIFLVGFGLVSLAVMIFFVLPKFLKIYEEMKADLPLLTTLLLKFSGLMRAYGFWILPLLLIVIYLSGRYLFRFRESIAADRLRMKLPLLGRIIHEIETASFLRTLGLLVQSGIPATPALLICSRVMGSAVFNEAALAIEKGVQMGNKLSAEMRSCGLFSETILNLVAVGEESGQLAQILVETAESMEKRIDDLIKGLLTFLEPLLILVVGIIIGLIVMSMLLPIFSLSSVLRRG